MSCIELFRCFFVVPFGILSVQYLLILFPSVQRTERSSQERRERKIKEAIKAKNWDEVTRLLQQEQSNAERRDRYHNRRIKDETIASKNAKKSVRYDVIASSDLNPEEALILEELRQAIREAKASLSEIDSKIVEMIAEQGSSYKETARYITEHYKKMSDVTVKSHYCKALKKLAPLLKAYR